MPDHVHAEESSRPNDARQEITRRRLIHSAAIGTTAMLATTPSALSYEANSAARIGWIGYGGRGHQLMETVLASLNDQVRHVAICDLKQDRIDLGQKKAERDKPSGYTDYRKMLEKEKLDAVLIATPPNTHGQIAIDVLQAGVHCFCEKSMETTLEKIDALVKVARQAKPIYQVGTQRRYHPGYLKAIPIIHAPDSGQITHMQGEWHWPWKLYHHSMEVRGGMLLDQSCHHFDVMNWVMKDTHPVTCVSMGFSQVDQGDGGPRAYSATHSSTTYQYPSGQLFSYSHLFCPASVGIGEIRHLGYTYSGET